MDIYTSHGKPAFTNYATALLADVADGQAMPLAVTEGSVVRDKSNGKIYRIVNGHNCHYPNFEVYTLHSKPQYQDLDSAVLTPIPDGHPILPPGVYEGMVVRDRNSGAIYRILHGAKCHYPNMDVYTAHGQPAFTEFDGHVVGPIPEGATVLPPGFHDGQVVRDKATGAIYRLVNGKKSHFPNMQVYTSHGSPAYTDFDSHALAPIPVGPSY